VIINSIRQKCEGPFQPTDIETGEISAVKVVCKWFMAMCSEGRPMTGPIIIKTL